MARAAPPNTALGEAFRVRSMWQGTIAFGLVSIPVKLYTASEDKDPHLRYLHKACLAPVRYRKVCSQCDVEVSDAELGLGYEHSPGHYVLVEREELQEIAGPDLKRRIEILQFPGISELDPVYFLKPYFVEPQPGGHRAYQLLRQALQEAGRAALCRLQLRQRPRLAVLRDYAEQSLVLETMHAPDEVRNVQELDLGGAVEPSEAEVRLASALVDTLKGPFEPAVHRDSYREALTGLLERKAEQAPPSPEQPVGEDMDALLARLRESLQALEAPHV